MVNVIHPYLSMEKTEQETVDGRRWTPEGLDLTPAVRPYPRDALQGGLRSDSLPQAVTAVLNRLFVCCVGRGICGYVGEEFHMDASRRALNLVNVSTSMFIVRFLSEHLKDAMGTFGTVLYSVLVIQITHLFKTEYSLLRLSRRISYLLIVEKIRPYATEWQDSNVFVHIQSLISNSMIIICTALVPREVAESEEGSIIVTAVMFMYSDVLMFLMQWKDINSVVLALSVAAVYILDNRTHRSRLWQVLTAIGSSVGVTLAHSIIVQWKGSSGVGIEYILFLMISSAIFYSGASFLELADSTKDYTVYLVALSIASTTKGWVWIAPLFLSLSCLRVWPGAKSWITQCILIVLINVIVKSALAYIEFLALHDTFVTLKTSALVLQFVIHELSSVLVFF